MVLPPVHVLAPSYSAAGLPGSPPLLQEGRHPLQAGCRRRGRHSASKRSVKSPERGSGRPTVASCEACLPWRRWYLTPVFGVGQPDLQAVDRQRPGGVLTTSALDSEWS